ncbi:hypothetical protein BpHYR1_024016 [Brachionus plicatilis]|uniref:Uncharacterized protein n=1 Tax=Brachionus plicatilis TaxID=10195 RepID=A0A3M7SIG6_BRAPC|nr:hypothetical protein BpHYR1_024016 [Brachionus plicatilis]
MIEIYFLNRITKTKQKYKIPLIRHQTSFEIVVTLVLVFFDQQNNIVIGVDPLFLLINRLHIVQGDRLLDRLGTHQNPHILLNNPLEQNHIDHCHDQHKRDQHAQVLQTDSVAVHFKAVHNEAQYAEAKHHKAEYVGHTIGVDNARVALERVELEQFSGVQKNTVELHEQGDHSVADGYEVDHVIAEREQHNPVVDAHDPFAFQVAVGANVIEVVEKVAARERQHQIGVPSDRVEQVGEQFAVAGDQNVQEPKGAEDRVDEADLEVAVGPDGEGELAVARLHLLALLSYFEDGVVLLAPSPQHRLLVPLKRLDRQLVVLLFVDH